MSDKPTVSKKGKSRFKQGRFSPRNPHKYMGNPTNIIYRSAWELLFLRFCDSNPNIIKYSSEETIIPYISPIDLKQHRYFVDFCLYAKQADGSIKKFLIEIKPYAQTQLPKPKKNIIAEKFKEQMNTYLVNQEKWKAARAYPESKDMTFCVLTERELFKQKKKGKK